MLPTKWSGGSITYEHPVIMGILNVTPDSFSDGGAYAKLNSAADHAFRLIDEGAGILDIGAESTRPGWKPVSAEEEIERLVPVIKEIAPSCDVPISVDTMKTRVAEAALDAGADIINDVYGLRWEGMAELAASAGVPVIIMHMYGEPERVHSDLMTGNVLPQIKEFFEERTKAALDAGIERNRIILDPGIG
ncbi:MAG: dihydropteroate synthase, partial [Candidatus Methanomethylophilaceae archaeon]